VRVRHALVALGATAAAACAGLIVLAEPFGREITATEWERRGPLARAREWLARRWEYFL
jgi:hypothetical protein